MWGEVRKFISNCGEDSPLNAYIPYNNIKSLDFRTKITIIHSQNMLRPVVNIDTNNIKSLDNLTTLELFTKYFSNDAFQLVDGKEKQQPKVISLNDEVGKLIESKQSQLTSNNAGDNITITGTGANIKINSNGGSSESLWEIDPNSPNIIQPKEKRIITSNNTRIVYIADLEQPQDGANKRYVDNEINKIQPSPTPSIPKWKDVATSDRETINFELKTNTYYRIFYDVEVKRARDLIGKYPCLISEFYWIYIDGSEWNDLSIYVPYMNNGNIMNLKINVSHKQISWKRNSNCGNFWKLQELQE